ncbi:MAG: hypothetical protein WA885_04320 [Phormidesmis sp.]
MLKSLIQPFQRLIHSASGKDRPDRRPDKKQLSQQLRRARIDHGCLQEDFNRLQQRYDELSQECLSLKLENECLQRDRAQIEAERDQCQSERDQYKQDYEAIKHDRGVVYKLAEEAENDLEICQMQLEETNRINATLKTRSSALLGQVALLNQQLKLEFHQRQSDEALSAALAILSPDLAEADDPDPTLIEKLAQVDLSNISLALIGGHDTSRREIDAELSARHGLKRCISIPPRSVKRSSAQQIKEKICQCDLIVIITSHIDHSISHSVMNIKQSGGLAGDVIRTDSHGKSGVIREILSYVLKREIAAV